MSHDYADHFARMTPEEDVMFVLQGGVLPAGVERAAARMAEAIKQAKAIRQGTVEGRLSSAERAQLVAFEIAREHQRLLQEVAAERPKRKRAAAPSCVAA